MKAYDGKIVVIVFVAAALLFCIFGLTIFRDVDPSQFDVTVLGQ